MNEIYNLFKEQNLRRLIVVLLCWWNLKRLETYCVEYEIIVMIFSYDGVVIGLDCFGMLYM